jgi:hypothetical protein
LMFPSGSPEGETACGHLPASAGFWSANYAKAADGTE